MGLTAEQKSQFVFEEFISSYGIDVENIKYPSGKATTTPTTLDKKDEAYWGGWGNQAVTLAGAMPNIIPNILKPSSWWGAVVVEPAKGAAAGIEGAFGPAKGICQQPDETRKLKTEHQQPIKLGANNLKQANEEMERDHVKKLQVVCAELDDVFENPALEYDDLKNFLEKLLQDESEKTSFVLLSYCTRYLSKKHGTKVVWLLRQYMTEELKRGGAQFYPEREGA